MVRIQIVQLAHHLGERHGLAAQGTLQ